MENHNPHIRVACYVRKSSLVAPVDSTLRTLDRLESEGVVDELTVGAWPAEVNLDDAGLHTDVVDLFEEYDAWADQWDVTIRPPFAVETRTSEITGESRQVLITPVQCLAVYVRGALAEVFPHSTARSGDVRTYTVQDALTLLEDHDIQAVDAGRYPETHLRELAGGTRPGRDPDSPDASDAPDVPDASDVPDAADAFEACPICEALLATGQGLYACSNCDWVGVATGPRRYRSIDVQAWDDADRLPSTTPTDDSPEPTPRR